MQHLEGPISRGSLGGIYRYDSNTVYRLEMKGWQVKQFMEYVVQNYYNRPTTAQLTTDLSPTHATSYNTDNLGGVKYTVDLTKANGSRVEITEVKRLSGEWQEYNPNETYIVAANDYRTSSRILTTSVFTQAQLDGTSAPTGYTAFAPNILEIDCTRGHETAPDIISLMAFYVNMKGGVIDSRDFERNWSIVPWWETTIENGAYLRAQGERLTQEGKITNVTNSNALKAATVIAALAAEPPRAFISAPEFSNLRAAEPVEYIISINKINRVGTITLEFVLDGGKLDFDKQQALNGFTAMSNVKWTTLENDRYKGELTLVYPGGSIVSAEALDVVKLFFYPTAIGDATVTLTKVAMTSQPVEGGEVKLIDVDLLNASAKTNIFIVYSIYDINRDEAVDRWDLDILARSCGIDQDHPRWDQTVVTIGNRSITPAMCDFLDLKVIDMRHLIELFANYTEK
jgi:hypothetical protein